MEESQWEQLSREELFQLESICDQFELDQRRCLASTLLQPSSYIEQLSGKLKEIAYLEMKRIQLELASEKAHWKSEAWMWWTPTRPILSNNARACTLRPNSNASRWKRDWGRGVQERFGRPSIPG